MEANGIRFDHRVRVARRLMPARPGGLLLDLGGGDGVVTAALAEATGASIAVCADLGHPGAQAGVGPVGVSLIDVRLPGPLPFADGTFDVVCSLEVIEHLLDPDAFLDEITRILSPDGVLVLSTPRLDGLLVIISLALGLQPPGVEAASRSRYGAPFGEQRPSGHVHLFTRRALRAALAAHGLVVDGYAEGRFSSSWWQAVRTSRRPGTLDLVLAALLRAYDLFPFRKDVMVVRAKRDGR